MSILPITRFPDPLLKQHTRAVERITQETRQLVDRMIATMRKHPHCVGLAAPQVGSNLRLAVMDASNHPKAKSSHGLLVLINPYLVMAGETIIQREGCLSIPDFTANVQRASCVHLRANDRYGFFCEWHLEGFEAIVAQHEVDHLNGKLFLDRVANLATDVFKRRTYM